MPLVGKAIGNLIPIGPVSHAPRLIFTDEELVQVKILSALDMFSPARPSPDARNRAPVVCRCGSRGCLHRDRLQWDQRKRKKAMSAPEGRGAGTYLRFSGMSSGTMAPDSSATGNVSEFAAGGRRKILILASHVIQYSSPLFAEWRKIRVSISKSPTAPCKARKLSFLRCGDHVQRQSAAAVAPLTDRQRPLTTSSTGQKTFSEPDQKAPEPSELAGDLHAKRVWMPEN